MSRGRFLKVRVSDGEMLEVRAKAFHAEMTVSDFLRFRAMDYRLRRTNADKERLRQLSRIGSNVNQLARWANTHKAAGPALEVVLWLDRIAHDIAEMAKADENNEGNGHAD
jgi:hypothetical protein